MGFRLAVGVALFAGFVGSGVVRADDGVELKVHRLPSGSIGSGEAIAVGVDKTADLHSLSVSMPKDGGDVLIYVAGKYVATAKASDEGRKTRHYSLSGKSGEILLVNPKSYGGTVYHDGVTVHYADAEKVIVPRDYIPQHAWDKIPEHARRYIPRSVVPEKEEVKPAPKYYQEEVKPTTQYYWDGRQWKSYYAAPAPKYYRSERDENLIPPHAVPYIPPHARQFIPPQAYQYPNQR